MGYDALCASPHLDQLVDVDLSGNAAPNPAREAGYEWTGAKVYVSPLPAIGEELERRHGYKRWLHAADLYPDHPVGYAVFDGDDPV